MKRIAKALRAAVFSRNETAAREMRRDTLSQVEHLESRLCLGSFSTPIAGEPGLPAVHSEPAIVLDQSDESFFPDVTHVIPEGDPPQQAEVGSGEAYATSTFEAAPPIQTADGQVETVVDSELGIALASSTNDASNHAAAPVEPQSDAGTGAGTPPVSGGQAESSDAVVAESPTVSESASGAGGSEDSAVSEARKAWDADSLASYGFTLDEDGNAVAVRAWWEQSDEPIVIRYDFRDVGTHDNVITEEQKARAVDAMNAWSAATGGMIVFEHDTTSPDSQILNIGTGDLAAFNHVSGAGGEISLGGGKLVTENGKPTVRGAIWMDKDENWDMVMGNGDPAGTLDFFTAAAHETGHALGLEHRDVPGTLMYPRYQYEFSMDAVSFAARTAVVDASYFSSSSKEFHVDALMGPPQLMPADVTTLLDRAAAASASSDAIIAIVDRGGHILGVRVESDALAAIPDEETLVFAIDGAVAKARTAAFFASNSAPLTSRTIQFISQSTVTQREVESNPNAEIDPMTGLRTAADVYASTIYGPGFVAPIGLGAHFPPEVAFTPPVDLFAIEHTNRDSLILPGDDDIKATADDETVAERFNIDPAFIPAGQNIDPPESYGAASESGRLPNAQSRGIGTLPGGIPIFRDTNLDGFGDTLIGGIGVFFPGADGYATHEQNFIPGADQTTFERLNADKVLEAEYIAFAALGGSLTAQQMGFRGAVIGDLDGVPRVADIDLPFGRLDLVGINLPVIGPIAGREGLKTILRLGRNTPQGSAADGANQPVATMFGDSVPEGVLVTPHDSALAGGPTAAEVAQIIQQGIDAANEVRAAIRLPRGSRAKMVFAVTDLEGNVLGLFRMNDATFFSIDVAVAKARNVAYYADATEIDPFDQVVDAGAAFTNRTFRFLSGPRYPDGIDGTSPGPFSILNHPGIDDDTAENVAGPPTAGTFDPAVSPATASVLGFDAFFPNTNFQDPDTGNSENRNGIVFFPGSVPIYRDGVLIGGFGVSGDGVDQDDVVTFFGSKGFEPPNPLRADQFFVRGVRQPYIKFLRNPFG